MNNTNKQRSEDAYLSPPSSKSNVYGNIHPTKQHQEQDGNNFPKTTMFGNQPQNNNENKPLFGVGNTNAALFENKGQIQNQQQPQNNLFGGQNTNPTPQPQNNLFGGQNTNPTPQPQNNLFGGQNTQQQQLSQSNILGGQSNLFGGQNTTTTPQPQSSLFGGQNTNPTPQPQIGLFGGQNTQQQNNLFGQPNSQQQPQSGLFGQPNTQQQQPQSGLFGQSNSQQQQQQQPQSGLFGQPMHQSIPHPSSLNYNPNIYSQTKILSLMPSNQLKYEKINYLKSKELKEIIKIVEENFENNKIHLNNFESIFEKIQENFKLLQCESYKIAKYTKLINNKSAKLKYILDNFNNDIRYQNEILNKSRDNLKIIEHHPSMKITVPSDYLEQMITEIQEFIQSQIEHISDLESLFDLNYQKQSGNLHVNSDIIEQIIVSFYENLCGLTEETSLICEKVEIIKQKYYIFLQRNLGWKDYEIENKFKENFNSKKNMEI